MKRFTSLVLVFVLIFALAIPIGATAPTQGVAQFTNSYLPVLIEEAKGNGPDWLTRTDLQLRFDDLLNPRYAVETVQPLTIRPSGVAFWQGRAATDGAGTEPTVNLGLGYRTVWADLPAIAGMNAFYDHSFGKNFSRLGVGAEFFEGNLEGRFNAYFPLTGASEVSRTATDKTMEQAVRGWDFDVGGPLPKAPWVEVFAGGKAMLNEHSAQDISLQARTQMQLTPHLKLEAGYQAKPDDKYVQLAYTLGASSRTSLADAKKTEIKLPDLSSKLLKKVERDNVIHTETWSEKITGGVTGYVYGNGSKLVIRSSSTAPTGYTAVNGAAVSVQGTSLATATASSGCFTLNSIPIGTITLVATSGALTVSGEVAVTEGAAVQVPDIGTVSTGGVLGGFVYRRDNVILISDSPTPPAGFVPVEGGTVTITAEDGTPITVTTDASGHFVAEEVPSGAATIAVDDGAGHTAESSATVTSEETKVTPDPVGIIEGYVFTNNAGSVVIRGDATPPYCYTAYAGVTVKVQGGAIQAAAAADGHFVLANVPVGSPTIEVLSGETVLASGQVTATANQTTAAQVGTPLTVRRVMGFAYLDDATNMMLRITNTNIVPTGYHIAAGSKFILNGTQAMITTETGWFEFLPLWSTNHTLVFDRDADGYVLSNEITITNENMIPVGSYPLTDSTPVGTIQGYLFTSGKNSIMQASATPPPGTSAAAGYTVTATPSNSASAAVTATTDGSGKFVIQGVRAGQVTVSFVWNPPPSSVPAVSGPATVSGPVTVAPESTVDAPYIGTGTVTGYVYKAGTSFIIRPTGTPPAGYVKVLNSSVTIGGRTTVLNPKSGLFSLYGIPCGTQPVTVTSTSSPLALEGTIDVPVNATIGASVGEALVL